MLNSAFGTSVGSRTLHLWSAVVIAAIFEVRWQGHRRDRAGAHPCWQPAGSRCLVSAPVLHHSLLAHPSLLPRARPQFLGAMLLGGNVTRTLSSGIANTATFAATPAVFMYGARATYL